MKNTTVIDGANLTLEELGILAEEIRVVLTNNVGLTLENYIKRALTIPPKELGYRKIKAICNEPKLEAYFPEEVYNALKNRFSKNTSYYLNNADKEFLNKNKERGFKWLSRYMYASTKSLSKTAKKYDIKVANKLHYYDPVTIEFITKYAVKGAPWIAEKLNLSPNAINSKAKRMGVKLGDHSKEKKYTPTEDLLIKDNANKGTHWLVIQIGASPYSIRRRAKFLGVKLPIIIKGKLIHKFAAQEDNFIKQNSSQGSFWIAKQLNLPVRSIQRRAQIIKVKMPIIQKKYTDEDIQFIKDNTDKGISYIADKFTVSMAAIKRKIDRMRLANKF